MNTNKNRFPRQINSVIKAQADARKGVRTYEPRVTAEALAAAAARR